MLTRIVHLLRVAESYDVSSDDKTINPDVPEGLANPMRRDTFMVPPEGGARTVRWKVDNPGAWFFVSSSNGST